MDLAHEEARLLDFARASVHRPFGFAWLDDNGRPLPDRGITTWVSCRMTHVFALAALRDAPGAEEVVEHGVRSLAGPLRDRRHGGWFASVDEEGRPVDARKQAYPHAFVVLAASSATAAGVEGAGALLDAALELVAGRFLDDDGRVVDGYARDFGSAEDYRGANSSMHMVEALLAVSDALAERSWHRRALVIAEHLVHDVARNHGYRMPEHFSEHWRPLPEYNADRPEDRFRPYGNTPGHLLEWSRLLLHLEAGMEQPPDWLVEDSRALFATAVRVGWHVDGAPGFVYTTDWADRPVVRSRMHWVHAEALAAASALHRRTGEEQYAEWERLWWGFTERHLLDRARGGWHHELDPANRPTSQVWSGKPDVYHAYQAVLAAELELAPSAAAQLAAARDRRKR
jgi:sulfoquinovose isomerase